MNLLNDRIFLTNNVEFPDMHDWMKAVRKPTSYRVGNTRFSLKPQFQLLIMVLCTLFIIIYLLLVFSDSPSSPNSNNQAVIPYNLQLSK